MVLPLLTGLGKALGGNATKQVARKTVKKILNRSNFLIKIKELLIFKIKFYQIYIVSNIFLYKFTQTKTNK